MIYLDKFMLPDADEEYWIAAKRRAENGGYLENGYPCMLFTEKELTELDFEPITLLVGGNGSGKSTLLNLIAMRLGLKRISPCNSGELMESYAACCKYRAGIYDDGSEAEIPENSRIMTSDDVFEYMLAARTNNDEIRTETQEAKGDYARLKYGESIRFTGMDSYEDFRLQVLSRRKALSRRQFMHKQIGTEVKLNSNGETALSFFDTHIEPDTLYCLDEPENSLSPKMQLELKTMLEQKKRLWGCQFIIATHSPFLMALSGAKLYDLDAVPVDVKNWWEMDSARLYYSFFKKNEGLFED